MKPSERIKELYKTLGEPKNTRDIVFMNITAIVGYLDEEYAKGEPHRCACHKCPNEPIYKQNL